MSAKEIRQFMLFKELEETDYQTLAEGFTEVTLTGDDYFINYDDTSSEIYLIVEGHVCIELDTVGYGKEVVANVGPGSTVGEFALAKLGRRSANVRAVGEVRALKTSAEKLASIFQNRPRMGYVVYRNLAEILVDRLKDTNMLARNALSTVMDLANKINTTYP